LVVKVLKKALYNGEEMSGTPENMRERDAGFMLAQCVLLNIENGRVTITNAQKNKMCFFILIPQNSTKSMKLPNLVI